MDAGRLKGWAQRWVQNPVVSVALFALLAWLLASARAGIVSAGIGRAVSDAVAVRDGGRVRIIDPDNESWDEATRLLQRALDDVAFINYAPEHRREGWLAPTRDIVTKVIGFDESKIARDPAARADARRAFVAWLSEPARHLSAADAAELSAGDVRHVTVLWRGYAHNALILASLVLLLYSLLWVRRIPPWLTSTRRQRALARRRCPFCGYSIAGLKEPVCPECGKSWDVTAEDPPLSAA